MPSPVGEQLRSALNRPIPSNTCYFRSITALLCDSKVTIDQRIAITDTDFHDTFPVCDREH
jgi:hypothetical protein